VTFVISTQENLGGVSLRPEGLEDLLELFLISDTFRGFSGYNLFARVHQIFL
jgi:hypothetical protein